MKAGQLEANPGEHVFGYLETGTSRSGLNPDIPVHLFAGAEPGPTLLVQGAIQWWRGHWVYCDPELH